MPTTSTAAVSRTTSPTRAWVGLAALCLAVLLVAVDATVLALALPSLAADLAPTGTQVLWIGDVYSFVLAGLLVPAAALGDRIGRRRLLLVGAAAFGAASALTAYAPTAEALIAARALLGVAGATIMPSTLSLVRALFPDARRRTLAVGAWSAAATSGAVLGPLVGGVLLENFWWGSVFLVNLPVVALFLLVAPAVLPEVRVPVPGRFDVAGAALALVAVVAVVFAVKEAAADGSAPLAVLALAAGATAGVLFVRRRHPAPVLDLGLFADRTFSAAAGVNLVAVLALAGLVFFVAQLFQLALGFSPLEAALRELPAAVGAVAGGLLAAPVTARAGTRASAAGGLAAAAAGLVVVAVAVPGAPYPVLGGGLLLAGLGAGVALTTGAATLVGSVPESRAGAAAAVSETAYELGTALGIALIGALLGVVYRGGLELPPGLTAGDAAAARDSLPGAAAVAGRLGEAGTELLTGAREAFAAAVRTSTGVAAAVVAGAAVLAARLLPRGGPAQSP